MFLEHVDQRYMVIPYSPPLRAALDLAAALCLFIQPALPLSTPPSPHTGGAAADAVHTPRAGHRPLHRLLGRQRHSGQQVAGATELRGWC